MTARASVERELRQWLAGHFGTIGRYEALGLGASGSQIRWKLHCGEWAGMHLAVYRDTAVERTPYQALRAAWLGTRGTGVVSHSAAGWLWGFLTEPPAQPELTIPAGASIGRGLQGVIVHRYADLGTARVVIRHTVPVTNPLRTMVDLAGSLAEAELTDAIDAAVATRLVTVTAFLAELERLGRRGRHGVGRLRGHLSARGFVGQPTASVLEARMLRLIAGTGLPLPTVNLHVGEHGEYRLDFAWPHLLFSVEVDGYLWHFSPEHLQRDLRRRNRIQDAGWTLRVYTWRDVSDEPGRVAREIVATYQAASTQ